MSHECPDRVKERIIPGKWSRDEIERMIASAATIRDAGERIDFVSRRFLGTPYGESTLIGSADVAEEFVINLEALDCFTYIDCVEAMRLSRSFDGFRRNLREVRYRQGSVSFANRNHFFTDWLGSGRVEEVTRETGRERVETVVKLLNRRADGTLFLPGLPATERKIDYIPATFLDESIKNRICTGDYLGVYAETPGLDVSHVGIAIRTDTGLLFRHASSLRRKVVEQDLGAYMNGKPGLVILRPRPRG
jgi:hypothetical protein